jgi:putative methyltransferase
VGCAFLSSFDHQFTEHLLRSLRNFTRDAHVENLLLFPPGARLVETGEYSDGRLILQDKASCFPAVVLAPPSHPMSVIIDATAAPGNKTSHLSALMGNQGKVRLRTYSVSAVWTVRLVDFSPPVGSRSLRLNVTASAMALSRRCWPELGAPMSRRLTWTSSPQILVTKNMPTLRICKFSLFTRASCLTHLLVGISLLDPSCSGSGIINRLDHLVESGVFAETSLEPPRVGH